MAYKNKEDQVARQRAYREANLEKRRAYDKQYYKANKGSDIYIAKRRAISLAWSKANPEKMVVVGKKWREVNRERDKLNKILYKEKNKEHIDIYLKSYREANREAMREYQKIRHAADPDAAKYRKAKRRALKLDLIPKHLIGCKIEKKRIKDIHKLRRLISKATGIMHHVDHMWPLAKGGPEWSGNMQIIPAKENLTKHASVCPELKRNIKQALKESANVFQ